MAAAYPPVLCAPSRPPSDSTVKPAPHGPGGGGGSASINFPTNDPVGINSSGTAEPSGASDPSGKIIFESANWYAAFSTDGGATFTQLNPTTIFPNNVDGGFCCDQIVQYAPSIDRFIWVMQYAATNPAPTPNPKNLPTKGPNLYRIASASPATVKSSGGTSWSYFDITSTAVLGATSTSWIDYPDTSVGSSNFFLSFDDVNNSSHVIVRIPLSNIHRPAARSTSVSPRAPTAPQPTAATSVRTPATRSSGQDTTPTAPSVFSTGLIPQTRIPGATSTSEVGPRSPPRTS